MKTKAICCGMVLLGLGMMGLSIYLLVALATPLPWKAILMVVGVTLLFVLVILVGFIGYALIVAAKHIMHLGAKRLDRDGNAGRGSTAS